MKVTHRVAINENPRIQYGANVRSVRVSKTRQYGACVVGTATVAALAWVDAQLAEHEAEVQRLQPLVEAAQKAIGGLSFKEAEAAHRELAAPWYKPLFANEKLLRDAGPRGSFYGLSDAQRAEAARMTVAQGLTNPYDHPLWTYLSLVRELDNHTFRAARYREQALKEGHQLVLGWHRNEAMAQKGLERHSWHVTMGYALAIRTDIEVTVK